MTASARVSRLEEYERELLEEWEREVDPPPDKAQIPPAAVESLTVEPFPTIRILEGEPKATPEMHVEGFLLDREINFMLGHGGTAKTVVILHTAVCVALGRDVFGTLKVHRPGPVLLVCPEDGESGVRMILDALTADFSETDKATLTERLIQIKDDAKVSITTDTKRLAATVKAHAAVLVILDPLGILLAGKPENDNDLAGATLDAIRRDVCRAENCTVQFSHHNRKPGKDFAATENTDTIFESRGAGAWANGSRLAFSVVKKDSRITLTSNKANRVKTGKKHELSLAITTDPNNEARWLTCTVRDKNVGSSSEALTPGKGRALSANEEQVLKALADTYEPGLRLSYSQWFKRSGLTAESTFGNIRERLIDANLVTRIATGRKTRQGAPEYTYEISTDGRQTVLTGWSYA